VGGDLMPVRYQEIRVLLHVPLAHAAGVKTLMNIL